jgi:hypothetical protein
MVQWWNTKLSDYYEAVIRPSILAAVTTSVRCFLVACLLAGSGLEDRSLVSLTKASVEKHCSSEHGSGCSSQNARTTVPLEGLRHLVAATLVGWDRECRYQLARGSRSSEQNLRLQFFLFNSIHIHTHHVKEKSSIRTLTFYIVFFLDEGGWKVLYGTGFLWGQLYPVVLVQEL